MINQSKNKLGQDIILHYSKYKNTKTIWKITQVVNHKFEMDERYQVLGKIGQGGYGIVVAAQDKMSLVKEPLAIKKCFNVFQHKIMAKRCLRQLKLQRLLKHRNILQINKLLLPKSRQQFQDLYIVTDMMNTDLYQIIRSQQQLSSQHIQYFMYQILCGLNYIHTSNVVHRDLKPRNILINKNCDIKICDFGLSRVLNPKQKVDQYTSYVITRTYRSPELLLGTAKYSVSCDIWSVGCIFAQLFLRKTLFTKMETYQHIQAIFKLIGTQNSSNLEYIDQQQFRFVQKMAQKKYEVTDFKTKFPNASQQALDLLKKMLVFNPKRRISAKQALSHEYFKNLRDPIYQVKGQPINPLDFQYQDYNLKTEQYKDLIYEQILLYHDKQFYQEYLKNKEKGVSLIKYILQNSNSKNYDPIKDDDDF